MSSHPVLVCQDLAKYYQEGPATVEVIKKINFQLEVGERVSIVGSSGSGKTTLLNLLGGLDTPSHGTVLLDNQDITLLNENQRGLVRNRSLGFVYQFHHLLPEFSAVENVSMPLLMRKEVSVKEAKARSIKLLEQVGLGHRLQHKPGELSGGERQRVAIARALVTQPKCVLLDEPTGNLDQHTAHSIHRLMHELSQTVNTAFVVVTHDLGLAQQMDRVLKLEDGQLVSVNKFQQ
ncbi:lipoprotein-releasing ABC transporter ATP-binding protein LolD [Endozoicomonas sp. SM1973]|uniref:Lipoprotein-releasing system ATP-binding protein LolD n=1 Tax=Spartinivicinus marinus TaxID=2994442 RepID=A0A853I4W2_9GAMM|nr:lipoprotein-releasing ABC transporter ATP-binding protein LolD [Spartinivicinus marinus]MCX4029417.1 lipoprotein-releasing ABC transporter ATP-binding protein LolD [Spartinivicinus marinus]NYZ64991.1 lipoprotein-releasing ABC transporter ATP-binding protein LolD [Spartinivicinus marinus]